MAFRHNPFGDSQAASETSSIHGISQVPHSRNGSGGSATSDEKHLFRSYRLTAPYEKPWVTDKRMKRTRYNNYIVYGFMVLGFALAAYVCYSTAAGVPKHNYCLVLDEEFKSIDPSVWNHEVQIDGFGTGSFDWTTTDSANAYTDANGLHIVPTLTNESTSITNAQIANGYTLNLTSDGTCTGTDASSCAIKSNSTIGTTIPPVRSARLNTMGKKSIKYGRVEVVAKLPVGDWLWPAIWMMPEDSVYGVWPRSGEIDIAESRGNDASYANGGIDTFTSTLHWGPASGFDAFWRTTNGRTLPRGDYSQSFHTFGMEWSENYLYTYIDTRLQQVLITGFGKPNTMWDRGGFASQTANNSVLVDPWASTGEYNTPFDQSFYLILNVAVGSRNGWFADGVGNKPWADAETYLAPGSFWQAVNKWLPTWGKGDARGMTVKSVKMWQQGTCGSPS